MKKFLLLSFMLTFVFAFGESWAQERTVSGKVTSIEDGAALPGVNVVLKGTTTGTVTDIDGNFTLTVPSEDGTLVFSFIGLATEEITIGSRSVVDLQMSPDVTQLSEVVVTGLSGATDRRKVPFTVASVNEDIIQNAPGVNAATALQGKVAGVNVTSMSGSPGSDAYITLRGVANLSGSQTPLIIIDGVITEGDGNLADINSEDIQSMEVVKGAAAASLYGSRAANGVINILTKRGADKGETTTVSVRSEYGQSWIPRSIDLATHHPYEMHQTVNGTDSTAVDYSTLSADRIANNEYSRIIDQQDVLFDPGDFSTLSVSVGNTTENTRFYASFTDTRQSGVVNLLEGLKRQNIKLNVDHDISEKLTFKTSTSYIQSTNDQAAQGAGTAFYGLLFTPPDVDLEAPNEEDGSLYNWDAAVPASLERNPLYRIANNDRTTTRNRYLGSYALEFRPLEFLKFEGAYTLEKRNQEYESFYPKGYLSDDVSGVANGGLIYDFDRSSYQTGSAKATFNKKFGDLAVTTQLYYLYEFREVRSTDVSGYDFRYNRLRSLGNSGLDDTGTNRTDADSHNFEEVANNYYAIVNLDYQDKIIFDGMFRRDGSSLFGVNNRWNNFYRGSAAYRISEDFQINGINELKVRGSIGAAGNRPRFEAQYTTFTESGTKRNTGNDDLKSSLQTEIELGIDSRFLDKFNFSFNYVQQRSTDMFFNRDLLYWDGGYQNRWINLDAQLDATIFEVTLGANVFKNANSSLDANVVFSKVSQTLTKFNYLDTQVGTNSAFLYREGEPYGIMYGNKFARSLDDLTAEQRSTGDFVINSDGFVVRKDQIGTINETPIKAVDEEGNAQFVIGDINPDFTAAFNFTFRFKGLTFYALWDWKQGGDVYNQTKQWTFRELRHGDVDQTGVPANEVKPVGYYAGLYNVNATTDYFVEDGSYVKLRELSVNYTIRPTGFLSAIKEVRFGIVGRNLLTLTKYSGYDPEVGSLNDSQNWAFDGFGYPNFTTLSGSVELKF